MPLTPAELAALGLPGELPAAEGRCGGWTPEQAGVARMLAAVQAGLAAWEATHVADTPAVFRIEIHPAVQGALIRTMVPGGPDRDELLRPRLGGELSTLFGIPIVVAALPPGVWRLVVPGPVLAEGVVGEDPGPVSVTMPRTPDGPANVAVVLGPCSRCGLPLTIRTIASEGVPGRYPGGVHDQMWCPACDWPDEERDLIL